MLDSLRPYEINIDADGNYPTYQFTTQSGVVYTAYFLSCSDWGPIFSHTYQFNFSPDKDTSKFGLDIRIAHTLVEILRRFFTTREQCAIYICDDRDDRSNRRFQVFDYWFKCVDDKTIYKKDIQAELSGYIINTSLLVHVENPDFDNIIEAYNLLYS